LANTVTANVVIVNRLGMHARPAMMFVETANRHPARITVRRCDQTECFDGKSIMQVMMLAATQGTKIEITAAGEGADAAIADLRALIDSKFGED
jgi:phosphocarrier protein